MKSNLVEVLYTDACPFWKETLKTIKNVTRELDIAVTVRKTRVANGEEAKYYRFRGSPTVRINGVDIAPAATETGEGFIGCRIYLYEGRTYDFPPKEMIESAFKRLTR